MTASVLRAEIQETHDGWQSERGGHQASRRRRDNETIRVMVAVDASKDLATDALEWALMNVVQRGDTVTMIGLIPNGDYLCGMSTKALLQSAIMKFIYRNAATCWQGNEDYQEQHQLLEDEATRKMEMLQGLNMLQHFYKICEEKGVHLDVKIEAGRMKNIVVQQAELIDATWVILDKNLSGGKGFYEQKLLCNVVLMKRSNVGDILRISYKY